MKESIYRTPRTYGSRTGYDFEMSHAPDHVARLAEALLRDALNGGEVLDAGADVLVKAAFDLAEAFYAEAEARGHLLEVKDAPGMKQDYGTERGQP